MKKKEMIEQLKKNSEILKKELVQLQDAFNIKKEQYVKIEGALEALSLLDSESEEPQTKE